jgi:saccharopine dehydrogenase (NADP+, L-glutamate forming)
LKRVLVLGAGLVAKPLLDELLMLPDVELHLDSLDIGRARRLIAGHPRAVALELDATDPAQVGPEISRADAVVSLLPASQHVGVARACLEHRVPLVTTSYVSDEMRGLDAEARRRGVLLLNETGLDPGLDHMTAMQVIRRIRRQGGRVISLSSYCGAIPAPESNTNPWGYKFAWSPRGVVLAARNPVRYLEGGQVVERTFPALFDSPRRVEIPGLGVLEAYPNRDCLRYLEPFGLRDVRDFYRGTLRYPGWSRTWHTLFDLGLLDLEPRSWTGATYAEFVGRHLPPGPEGIVERLARAAGLDADDEVVSRLEWLGLLSDRRLPESEASSLDVLSNRLEKKLRYREGERDMVVLEHRFVATDAEGARRRITVRLLAFGTAGDESALARTVSIPAAIACRLVVDRRVDLTGVQIPVDAQLTVPILLGVERRGFHVQEIEEPIDEGPSAQ